MDAKKRFLSYVRVDGDHWIWTGAQERGIGVFWLEGKREYAHRASWRLFRGPIPETLSILHQHEGMALCVNPEHLKPGGQLENVLDYLLARGKKLTPEQVMEIQVSSLSRRELALKFEVSVPCIRNIKTGRSWRWLNKQADRGRI